MPEEEKVEIPVGELAAEMLKEETPASPEENAEVIEEVEEKESDTQPDEEATALDEIVEEDVELTEEDLDAEPEEEDDKTGVQKRIDKLVYERNSTREELDKLRSEVSDLKADRKSSEESFNKPKYSKEQLSEAKQKAFDEGDLKLLDEIWKQELKWAQFEAEEKFIAPQKRLQEIGLKANAAWESYVSDYQYKGYKDLEIENPQSLVRKQMDKLIRGNPNYYNFETLGARIYTEAAEKAVNQVLWARNNKLSNRKVQKLQKEIGKEKIKTQLGSGVSSGSVKGSKRVGKKKSKLDAFADERNEVWKRSQGMISPEKK